MPKLLFYIPLYALILAVSLAVSMSFMLFPFVDNDHSYLRCHKDGRNYETGPNYIFAFDEKSLDSFNDIKARKLCEHQIISDYINSYPVPPNVNYDYLPALVQYSSWLNVSFIFILTSFLGALIIEAVGKFLGLGRSSFGQSLFNLFSELIV